MRFSSFFAAVLAAGTAMFSLFAAEPAERKLVAFAWEFNGDSAADLLKIVDRMDRTALDGIGVNLTAWTKTNGVPVRLSYRNLMHDPVWTKEVFRDQVPDLKKLTKHRSMKECFVSSFRAPRTYVPWEDDAEWARIAGSMRTVAWVAREGGLRGLYVDPEDYKHVRQFVRRGNEAPYDELCALVRRRAHEVFGPVFEEFPAARLHFFWFLSHLEHYLKSDRADVASMARDDGLLWPAFLNGILDVLPPTARISDGDEDSYRYLSDSNGFVRGAYLQRKRYLPLVAPENRAKYLAQVGYAPSVYLDMFRNGEGATWYKGPVEGTRLERLRRDMIQAFDASDGYVWFWGEQCTWVRRDKGWKPSDDRIRRTTWEELMPGLNWTLDWAKDPVALYDRAVAERSGKLVNLAEKTQIAVTNGYVTMPIKGVKGGEYYGVAYDLKGHSARCNVFFRNAQEKYVKPSINMVYAKDGRGVVRVPEGGARGTVVFSAENRPGEKTVFDNIRLYRLREAPSECAKEPVAPDLKVGIVSDIHLSPPEQHKSQGAIDVFVKTLKFFRDERVDAVLIAGDLTNGGTMTELRIVAEAWKSVFGEGGPERIFVTGNHEKVYFEKAKKEGKLDSPVYKDGLYLDVRKNWKDLFGEEWSPFFIKTVKGYSFVGAHWGEWFRDGDLKAFLTAHRGELKANKPFFFVQHAHPQDTCYGTWTWHQADGGKVAKILADYPNAVAFSGHTHYTLTDERSVWQGAFTSLGTGSLRWLAMPGGRENSGDTKAGGGARMSNEFWCSQGMVMEVRGETMVFRRYDMDRQEPLGDDWVVPVLHSKDGPRDFAFDARAAKHPAPEFPEEAKITLTRRQGKNPQKEPEEQVVLTFPAAVGTDDVSRVFEYEVAAEFAEYDVVRKACVKRVYQPGAHWNVGRQAKTARCVFGLSELPKCPFRFSVTPMNSYGRRGRPIFLKQKP